MTDPPQRPRRAPLLKPDRRAEWYRWTEASAIGLEMGIAIAIGYFGGRWLERNVTHWSPWTMYLGLLAGIGAATLAIVRTVRKFSAELAAEEEQGQSHDPGSDTASQSADDAPAADHTRPGEP